MRDDKSSQRFGNFEGPYSKENPHLDITIGKVIKNVEQSLNFEYPQTIENLLRHSNRAKVEFKILEELFEYSYKKLNFDYASKNIYTDIAPFYENGVVLGDQLDSTTYINASHIKSAYKELNPLIIAT